MCYKERTTLSREALAVNGTPTVTVVRRMAWRVLRRPRVVGSETEKPRRETYIWLSIRRSSGRADRRVLPN
jgi:hypothetical protein